MTHTVQLNNAPEFLGRLIRTAKPYMLPREFIRNAIDNPVPGVDLLLNWLIDQTAPGAPKIALLDNARGMSHDELVTFSQTAGVSLGTKDATYNFGVGARLIGLRSHQRGVEYFSRHVDDPAIHRTMFYLNDEGHLCATDVTQVDKAPVDLGPHGTLVVFHGREAAHNTCEEPFEGSKAQGKVALIKSIVTRFYRLRDGTKVRVDKGLHAGGNIERPIMTMEEHAASSAQCKVVDLPDGVRLHYALFPDKGEGDSRQFMSGATISGCGGVMWHDELYHQCDGRIWESEAAYFGIDTIAFRSWVIVELPTAYPDVEPETDRTSLQWKTAQYGRDGYEARRTYAHVRNFRREIMEHMPDFFRNAVKDTKDRSHEDERKQNALDFRNMMREFDARELGVVPSPGGTIPGVLNPAVPGPNPGPGPRPVPNPVPAPTVLPQPHGPRNGKPGLLLPPALDIRFVKDCKEEGADGDAPIRIIPGIDTTLPELRLSEAFPQMKATKASCRQRLPMYDDEAFEKWWQHKGELAARLTYGRHYVSAYVYAKQGREDEAKAMLAQPSTLAAIAHHLDFNKSMVRFAEAEKKLAAVVTG